MKKDKRNFPDNILFKDEAAEKFIEENNYADAAKLMFNSQKEAWPLLKKSCESFKGIKVREFQFDNFTIKLQYNPERILSSTAAVDRESIKKRKCFLCAGNLYPGQKIILCGPDYFITPNPFPIFNEHFTIPHLKHVPQLIKGSFIDMLNLSKELSTYYSVLYNGPKCGASAPDHLHFQAGEKYFLPVEKEIEKLKSTCGKNLFKDEQIEVNEIDDGLRRLFSIRGRSEKIVAAIFNIIYGEFEKLNRIKDEPPMNIISNYVEETGWNILIFLRAKHRPSHYFAEGDGRILFSPGVADLGGICIFPKEKDFNKITKEILKEIFNEISITKKNFEVIKTGVNEKIKISIKN